MKTIRNTGFTLLVLGLAAVALSWNHRVIVDRMTTLQAASPLVVSSVSKNTLPLQVYAGTASLKVGDTFKATILTSPNSIVTVQLTSVQPSAKPVVVTAQADSQGYYIYQNKMSDYGFVGRVGLSVNAKLDGAEASRSTTFILDTWGGTLSDQLPQTTYSHPLVP